MMAPWLFEHQRTGAVAPVLWCALFNGGTSEHPEELTDRCCLSALAGLSKYLPLLGAGGIIAFWSDMSTLAFSVDVLSIMFIRLEERSPC
jgi:hypothetical protein